MGNINTRRTEYKIKFIDSKILKPCINKYEFCEIFSPSLGGYLIGIATISIPFDRNTIISAVKKHLLEYTGGFELMSENKTVFSNTYKYSKIQQHRVIKYLKYFLYNESDDVINKIRCIYLFDENDSYIELAIWNSNYIRNKDDKSFGVLFWRKNNAFRSIWCCL
jgi:hypothetical protein